MCCSAVSTPRQLGRLSPAAYPPLPWKPWMRYARGWGYPGHRGREARLTPTSSGIMRTCVSTWRTTHCSRTSSRQLGKQQQQQQQCWRRLDRRNYREQRR
ncbi:unnamed protein product [Ectocarpus fasciculatus]